MEPEGQFQGEKWGVFLTVLPVRNSFCLMNRNYSIKASSIQKIALLPRWELRQTIKTAHFSVKPLTTLTCRNSVINPVTHKFYFVILIRVENETDHESLTDQ